MGERKEKGEINSDKRWKALGSEYQEVYGWGGGLAISGHRLVEGLAREAPNTSRKVDNYTVCRSLSEVELAW